MSDVLIIGLGIVLLTVLMVGGYVVWLIIAMRSRRPVEEGFQYVWVNDDGTAREVTPVERRRLSSEYRDGDSRRAYVKLSYASKNKQGGRCGFLRRRQLPKDIVVEREEGTDE